MDAWLPYSAPVLLAVACIFLIGGVVKGALGFGLPLVTMSLLPLVIPVEVALAINALATPFNNIEQLRRAAPWRPVLQRFWPVVASTAAGILLGALFVSSLNERVLILTLGCAVLSFIALNVLKPAVAIRPDRETPYGLLTGFAGGIVGALTTANGPVYIMYLVGLKVERPVFVASLGLFFIVTGVVLSASFLALGLITVPIAILALLCIPAANVGMRAGFWLAGKVSAEKFRIVVLMVLAALGLNLIAQGLAL